MTNQRRGAMLRIIIVAWVLGSCVAFLPSAQCGSHQSKGSVCDLVQCKNHRPYGSSRSPLLVALTSTDVTTKTYNMRYLTEVLGISDSKMEKLSRSQWNILTLEIGVLEKRVHWLTKRLKLRTTEMKKIAQRLPNLLQQQPETTFAPKLDFLQTRLLLDDASLRKLILAAPEVLKCSIGDNLEPKLDWLQRRLHLDDAAVVKMIRRLPTIFYYSVEGNLEPKLEWLHQRLNLDGAAVGKMVQRLPSLLSFSVDDNMKPKVGWLQQRLDLDDAAIGKMIQQCPFIFSTTADTIETKLNWLQWRLHLDDAALSAMIQRLPRILSCNVDTNIKPTLNFYIDALGNEREVFVLVTSYPDLFSYSLEKRLKPRLRDAKDAGIVIDSGCLIRLAKYTDDRWQKSLAFQAKELEIGSQRRNRGRAMDV